MKTIFLILLSFFILNCAGIGKKTKRENNRELADQKALAVASLKRTNYKQSVEEIAMAEEIDDTDPEVYLIKGLIYFSIEDYAVAEDSYKKAIELDPNYSEAHNNICVLYLKRKRYDDAIKHCLIAAEDRLYKTRFKAYTTAGVAYFNKGDREKAEELYAKSLKINPVYVYTLIEYGKLYSSYGRLDDAIDSFKKAVEGYPYYVEAHINLGKVYVQKKEIKNACDSFNKVLAISPNSKYGLTAQNYVKSLCIGKNIEISE